MDQNRGFREVAPPDEAEQHAQRSQLTMNKTGKRSYQRACKVALAKGAALYKGRLLTAQALGAHEGQFASPAKAERRSFQPKRQIHHKFDMEVLTWNAGSITSRVWNEILALLATTEYKNIKIVFLQESHWQQDQVYSSGPWSVLTCGSTSRHKAGLVVLVHSSLAPLSEIRSTSIVPGHLQHVMIPWQRSRIHLLNLYQHVWDSKLSKTENRGRRKDVMTQLENRIQRVPQRDFLIVAGDFNAHAVTERPHIGPSVPHRVRFANADVKTLPSLCKSCGLTALNTWASGHRSTYANSDGTYSSQIDFLLVRLHDARRRSKEAYSDKNFPVAAYRDGSKHFPVRATLFIPPYSPTPSKPRPFDATALDASFRRKDDNWQAYSHRLTEAVVRTMQVRPSWQELDEVMVSVSAEHYPPPRKSQPVAGPIHQEYWKKVRQIQAHKRAGTEHNSECQKLVEDIKEEARTFKKQQKQRKLEKQEQLLLQAQEDKRQQSHKLAHTLRKLAPWRPVQRVNLRDQAGEPLDTEASLKTMREYSSQIFSKSSPLHSVAAVPRAAITALQVSSQIKTVPVGKAVPSTSAPVSAWKSLGPEAHEHIAGLINSEVSQSEISPYLKDPRIAWIPKPGKPATAMQNLRPIGVISVPGKVLAGAVKTRIAPALQVSSQLQPQFAYIRQRGVRDAIAKACQHLDFAQQLRQEHRRDLHKSQCGARQAQLSGAPTISVDLSKAFDSVNRHELLAALDRLGIDPVTKELVVQLHSETSYNMGTSGLEIQVPTSSGIKQGCKLAPALWSALTLLVMSRMEQKWGPDSKQARDILTVFADDFLLQETFSSFPELQKVLLRLEALFQSLEDVGLEVNPTKSKALLMVQGTQQSIFRKKHTMRKEKQLHIVLPSGHKIPIHHKLTYLGVQLSYGSYKDQTVDYRIAQAQGKFELLRHILCSTKALEASKKLEIWRVYVESSLLHGLVATGITSSGLQKLQSKYSRMLRSIFKQHQHYSHIDTKTLFEQHKVQTPQAVLISQMKNYQDALDACQKYNPDQNIQWYLGLRGRIVALQQELQSMHLDLTEADQEVPCSLCDRKFSSAKGLQQHTLVKHGGQRANQLGPKFQVTVHSCKGLPQCAACNRQLRTMHQLRRHVESGICPQLHELKERAKSCTSSESIAMIYQSSVQEQLKKDPDLLLKKRHVTQHLLTNCSLCGQYIVGHKGVKQHIQKAHPAFWAQSSASILANMRTHKRLLHKKEECRYCRIVVDAPVRHAEQCVVLLQTYAMSAACAKPMELPDLFSADPPISQVRGREASSQEASSTSGIRSHQAPASSQRDAPAEGRPSSVPVTAWSLAYHNPHQLCYAHTVVHILASLASEGILSDPYLRQILTEIDAVGGRSSSVDVRRLRQLRPLLTGWRFRPRQEDASQFLAHIIQRSHVLSADVWEARVQITAPVERISVEDRGGLILFLPDPPDGLSTLQQAISQWAHRGSTYGLLPGVNLVCIQIQRFEHLEKTNRPQVLDTTLELPEFIDNGTTTAVVSFRLYAFIIHLGDDWRSGHYRTGFLREEVAYLADDDRSPRRTTLLSDQICQGSYLAFYVRV